MFYFSLSNNQLSAHSNPNCSRRLMLSFKWTSNIAVSLFWPILQFFRPVIPVNIRVVYDDNGRPSGEADVEFNNHDDALRAMSKDKSHMQHRYIELFLNSTPGNSGGGYGNGGGFNSGKH